MLIMRALLVSRSGAWEILRPSAAVQVAPDHLWPSISADDWIKVELKLMDLVVDDYCRKNSVKPGALTSSEVRDIILGIQISPPSDERQQLADEEAARTAVTSRTVTKTGDKVVVQTLSSYEQSLFVSRSDWRGRAIQAGSLWGRTGRFHVPPEGSNEGPTWVIPLNLVKRFVAMSDAYVQISAILYGKTEEDVVEVHSFVIPPQTGTYERVDFVKNTPMHECLGDLAVVGLIHTTALDEKAMAPQDAINFTSICDINAASIVISYVPGACCVRGYQLEPAGFEWALQNRETRDRPIGWDDEFYRQVPVLITESYQGWFMVPLGIDWNLNFRPLQIGEIDVYEIELGIPRNFFDQRFRANHFLQFATEMVGEEDGGVEVEDVFA
jgi:pre-mRNA-processing factor 8